MIFLLPITLLITNDNYKFVINETLKIYNDDDDYDYDYDDDDDDNDNDDDDDDDAIKYQLLTHFNVLCV